MHPTIMIALAREVERARQNERQKLEVRSQALAERGRGSRRVRLASELARTLTLTPAISPSPRLS